MRVKEEFQSALDDFRYEPQNLFWGGHVRNANINDVNTLMQNLTFEPITRHRFLTYG